MAKPARFFRLTLIGALIGALSGTAVPAGAQSAVPAGAPSPAPSDPKPPSATRTRIELPAAERQAMERQSESRPPAVTSEDLVPGAADQTAPARDERGPLIEQRRTSNRISEIRVTPAFSSHSYLITNREGRQPTSITDMSSGLSIPKFFSFDFGRPTSNPSVPLPPPSR